MCYDAYSSLQGSFAERVIGFPSPMLDQLFQREVGRRLFSMFYVSKQKFIKTIYLWVPDPYSIVR
jgi:hypothetical protein